MDQNYQNYNYDPNLPGGNAYNPPPPRNTSRTIMIVVGILLLLCCCCVVGGLLMYYVFGDMITNAMGITSQYLLPVLTV